ncbi:type II CRISPR-associated endonuclease Cas1 [Isobaculum melis]|uniref:CRISPR-associated endonuclease Cas1 n=1 Tax=Isobaculum melis TaxID=142588 RepID=A0A1H9RP81_9LACT|nr:type II CRISPR-associated endonuclease Cas1 [Isobaculum melis]SER73903.1 CRISP-associated protein Cas1 [Isobaculum melis]
MAFRNIYIENPAKLSIKNQQLVIKQDEEYQIPVDDIQSVMIEHQQCSITIPTISYLAENQVALFTCDERHLPCSVLLPLGNHSRKLQILSYQFGLQKRTKNRIWKKIIQQKIINQGKCLAFNKKDESEVLFSLANRVEEGDRTFCESQAAQIYFLALFGEGFNRRHDHIQNAALNYGYSILRGVLARDICAYGLEPSIGVFHRNELNPFNLADDLIEPFRPYIDLWVAKNVYEEDLMLTSKMKRELFSLLFTKVPIDEGHHSLANALKKMTSSFTACCRNNSAALLKVPELMKLQAHEYE